jgi:hypothetical protein
VPRIGGSLGRSGKLTNIDILDTLLAKNLSHPASQLDTHVLTATVNRDSIDIAVRSSKVDILEKIRSVRLPLNNLAELRDTSLLDKDSLAGKNVDNVLESKL